MAVVPFIIIGMQTLFVVAAIVGLVYVIVKRVEDKKNETFEQRDN